MPLDPNAIARDEMSRREDAGHFRTRTAAAAFERDLRRAVLEVQRDQEICADLHAATAIDAALAAIALRRQQAYPAYLLERLRELGCHLRVEGGTLYVGPSAAVAPLAGEVREWRGELMREVQTNGSR